MTKIKIEEKNRERIEEELRLAQMGCRTRMIDADDILKETKKIAKKVDNMLYKKDQNGVKVYTDMSAQTFLYAYRGEPNSTHFTITKFSSGWFLTHVSRRRVCSPANGQQIAMSNEQKKAMADFIIKNF